MDLKKIIENTKQVYMSKSSLEYLLDFERVLDELHTYTFKNWKDGELVEGPIFEKYFIGAKFMWPYKSMPDPQLVERLSPYGIEINYQKEELVYPVRIKTQDDYRGDGSRKGKLESKPVWIVEIIMPKKLMKSIQEGSLELEGSTVRLDDIESAYEQDLDSPKGISNNE